MSFEPNRTTQRQPKGHSIDPILLRCGKCGFDQLACFMNPYCQPDSEEARKFRREMMDESVGRAIQRWCC
jgi:hypothetical protein